MPSVNLRSHPKYKDAELYGTITGDGASATGSGANDGPSGGKAMKDGAMSFGAPGSSKIKGKKEEATAVEKEKSSKDVKAEKSSTSNSKQVCTQITTAAQRECSCRLLRSQQSLRRKRRTQPHIHR